MTYARARLWLGISGVGFIVLLSTLALVMGWPQAVFGQIPNNLSADVAALGWILLAYGVLHLPLDYVGGYWLPCHFSRQCLLFSYFFSQYIRGTIVQSIILLLSALAVLAAGRAGGRPGALLLIFLVMLFMVEGQAWLAKLVAGLKITPQAQPLHGHPVVYIGGWDAGFSGGVVGLPGRERLVLPSLWQRVLPKEALNLELTRRLAALETGSRLRGLAVAIVWNLSGFALCSFLPGAGVTTVAELLATSLGFTLWSFLGLLLLPTASRRGVYELDEFARRIGVRSDQFSAAVREIDQLQDDEPRRSSGIETIFHPVPSVERRVEQYEDASPRRGAWNAARYALFLSWPCMGWLNRAVHCNSGRPELWVMLPTD